MLEIADCPACYSDAEPEKERNCTCGFSSLSGMILLRVLPRDLDLHGEVKQQSDQEEPHLDAEGRVVVIAHGTGGEEQRPCQKHDNDSRDCNRKKLARHSRSRLAGEGEAKQT